MSIDWNKYKDTIIALSKANLSSSQISEILSVGNKQIKPKHDRQVRMVVQKWKEENGVDTTRKPKVLIFDIETSPMKAFIWQQKTRFVPDAMVMSESFVLSWAAKWLFEDDVFSDVVTPKEARNMDDKRIVENLWKILDEADVVIAHNGINFDTRHMNGRFLKYGLNLPSPYVQIDTLRASRKRLRLSSYRLDAIAKFLGTEVKKSTNFQLWLDCLSGDKEALKKMDEYCQQDIRVLEDVYLHLRPYIQPHPNLGVYIEENAQACPACLSTNLEKTGEYATTVNLYDAYRCKSCGSLTRSRKSSLTNKDHITSSIPR